MTKSAKRIYRHSKSAWRNTWILGSFLLSVDLVSGFNLKYFYSYFFAVGAISLALSYLRYIVIDDKGLAIYQTSIFRKWKAEVPWEQVSSAALTSIEIKSRASYGGRLFITVAEKREVTAVVVTLAYPLSPETRNIIDNCKSKKIFPTGIDTNNSGLEIYIKEPPAGGFAKFLSGMGRYTEVIKRNRNNIYSTLHVNVTIAKLIVSVLAVTLLLFYLKHSG